jgi:hypothetical protein
MSAIHDEAVSASALKRIRGLSRPITVLLTIALGLALLVQVPEILAILFAFHPGDRWQALVSVSDIGFGLAGFEAAHPIRPYPGAVSLGTLSLQQRAAIAALASVCAGCSAMTLLNLRQLFALYSRGSVFSGDSVGRMKRFALWLVLAAVSINVSGWIFIRITGAAPAVPANVLLTLFYGAMIYVVARVMELACAADVERREFI